jgi:hypothetical protein
MSLCVNRYLFCNSGLYLYLLCLLLLPGILRYKLPQTGYRNGPEIGPETGCCFLKTGYRFLAFWHGGINK